LARARRVAAVRSRERDAHGDGAAATAHVDHAKARRAEASQRQLDQQLGLRAWHEDAGAHEERVAEERALTEEIGERRMAGGAVQQRGEARHRIGRHAGLGMGVEPGALAAECVR
jgi:hypothetical protein